MHLHEAVDECVRFDTQAFLIDFGTYKILLSSYLCYWETCKTKYDVWMTVVTTVYRHGHYVKLWAAILLSKEESCRNNVQNNNSDLLVHTYKRFS
jgi:hypothetical protein